MNLDAYLDRIGIGQVPKPDLAGLTALHRAHLRAIPYENLDVQLGVAVSLDPEEIFHKLVTRRRGGWCYEMNGLLGWGLGELGFEVTRATGAVMRAMRGPASEGNHLVLKVELEEGRFLADVGFGDGSLDPIRVEVGHFNSNGFAFALSRVDETWWRLHNRPHGGAPSFDFNLAPADELRLQSQCHWLQTSPESLFVQNAVCQRHTDKGLAVMRGRVLRMIAPDGMCDTLIERASDYVDVLRDVFGMDLSEAQTLWPDICARHDSLFATTRSPE